MVNLIALFLWIPTTGDFVVSDPKALGAIGQLGLYVGDVLERINGCDLRGSAEITAIYQSLRDAPVVVMDVRRGEARLVLRHEVATKATTLTPLADYKGERPACSVPPAASAAAMLVPSFKNGVMNGLKVFGVQPRDWFDAHGIVKGDVIRRIGGCELAPEAWAKKLLDKARAAPGDLIIEVQRRGNVLRLARTAEGDIAATPTADGAGDRPECREAR